MRKIILSVLVLLFFCSVAMAHVIPYNPDKGQDENVFLKYLILGYRHILPLGLDHILFILCVFFLETGIRKIIIQASLFTLAHSVTLGLAVYGVIDPPPVIVEPVIALSILLLALENIYSGKTGPWRMAMIFVFGLVHGMGFAGALAETGLPGNAFAEGLVGFNVGVELGQLSIIAGMYLLVQRLFSAKPWYRRRIVIPASAGIALVAAYWTVERIL